MADDAKQIKYLNLGFKEFVKDLKDFSRIYFPKTSKDLSDFSSGLMMLEQAAFVSDVLSFYLENRFANSNLQTATDVNSIFNLARSLGYPLSGPPPASGEESFYLIVPAITGSSGGYIPDMRYAINFKNVQLQNNNGIIFEALDDVNFSEINISSSAEARVATRNSSGIPTYFALKKKVDVIAGKTVTQTTTVGEYKAFREIEISEPNVIEVISIVDSDGDEWFEVDYHAQEAIFEGVQNLGSDSEDVPYILKIKTVPKRFVKRVDPSTGKTTLVFGSGKASEIGTPFVPKPSDIALDLKGKLTFSPTFIDPQNFLRTRTLGLAPYNTTLTIRSRIGGGSITNTAVGGLRNIIGKESEFNSAGLDNTELNNTLASLAGENESPIVGGDEPLTPEEVKQHASAFFAAQGRINTREDYIARSLSLPNKFGKVFRVYAANNCALNAGVQLYVIAKNSLGQLSTPTDTLKKNLRVYLSKYTRLNQGIDILDGKIINLGIEYSIVVKPGENKSKVKIDTLKKVKEFFDIEKWQLNQPIIIDDIICLVKETSGVLTVSNLRIFNKNNVVDGTTYSTVAFNVDENTKNGIIFCQSDSIFEVKYRNGPDIKVSAL